MCDGVKRPELGYVDRDAEVQQAPWATLDSLQPGLGIVWLVGLEDSVPDRATNKHAYEWAARMRDYAARDPVQFRAMLTYAMEIGLRQQSLSDGQIGQAAGWYRETWGRAEPLLPHLQDLPSDRLLHPLSALRPPLRPVEEKFVFRVACDAAVALAALRAAGITPGPYSQHPLSWSYAAEVILRQAERLIQGPWRERMAALIAAVPPQISARGL
jgi:hypothetical protein